MKCIKQFLLKQKQNYCLLVISIFMLASCTANTPSPLTNTITATLTNDQTGLPTQVTPEEVPQQPLSIHTPQPSATSIAPALTQTSTPSPMTSLPTPMPTPTLTSKQKAENFTRLMTENGGCELPCWWGIIPGESKIETIAYQFVPQGFVWWEEWQQLDASSSSSGAIVTFVVEEKIIQSIKVGGRGEGEEFVQDWRHYSLDQVLTRYGTPSQVSVYYPWKADPGPSFYHLLLFYETSGIEIYNGLEN